MMLMEHASRNAALCLQDVLGARSDLRILIACGTGNNGGDGLAMARHLSDQHRVDVLCTPDTSKMSDETRDNYETACQLVRVAAWQTPEADDVLATDHDVVIDALIGVGGGANLRAPVDTQCERLNRRHGLKVSVDVPTGLDAVTGDAHPHAFRAQHTITMAAAKPGLYRNEGPAHSGTVHVVGIGAPTQVIEAHAAMHILEHSDVRAWLPVRQRSTSKFDYGRVLVVAGSRDMRGAAALTAHAALVAGTGLVDLAAPVLHPLIPREVMTTTLPSTEKGTIAHDALAMILAKAERASVIAVGPGLSDDPESLDVIHAFLHQVDPAKPVVIDADALRVVTTCTRRMDNMICTPHVGEFARILTLDRDAMRRRVVEHAIDAAARFGCIMHVKDVPSITTNGQDHVLTVNGNPGMATAGSGDVLTGIIAGFLAQGLAPFRAAALGAYVHAAAGDAYAATKPMETLLASDLLDALDAVL